MLVLFYGGPWWGWRVLAWTYGCWGGAGARDARCYVFHIPVVSMNDPLLSHVQKLEARFCFGNPTPPLGVSTSIRGLAFNLTYFENRE